MRVWKVFILTALLSACAFSVSRASCPNPTVEELRIQMHKSSAEIPTPLKRPKAAANLGCDRPFIFHGEVYSVDPPQAQDASNLRSFVKEVPEAESLLQTYQDRRDRSRLSAYSGTIGLLMVILANTVLKRPSTPSQESLKSVFQVGGLGLTVAGFAYSYSLLRTNESLIPQAVDAYNRAKPNDPIELKFQAGWSF